ncbi:MAG TPA: hypothetical protein VGN72_17770 [Tepidisphaeraceae bacterium]|jgi:hypothetical protein|nr:hypothetical protein [Tepidisphaeraceae bacterium]
MWKDIAKKNAISIACGVVILIALIASIWPADAWVEALQSRMNARKAVNTSLEGLARKTRYLPNLDPNSTEQVPLRPFPNQTLIKQGTEATEQMKSVSQRLFTAAINVNQRPLLVPGSVPRSGDVKKLDFLNAYRAAFAMPWELNNRLAPEFNIPVGILKSAQPPSPEQITLAQDQMWADKYIPKIVTINGQPANAEQVSNDFVTEASKLPEQMRRQTAEQAKIYLLPGALTLNPALQPNTPPREEDIWTSQVSLWIQQDVARAIAATNASSQSGIIDAPVKQLIQLNVPLTPLGTTGAASAAGAGRFGMGGPPGMMGMGGMGGGEEAAGTGAKVSDPTEALTFDFTRSPTGRVTNGLYDVHEFVLVADVDAARLPELLAELTREKFVAVHSIDMEPVDLNQQKAAGFIYGSAPVVRVTMHCEMLFLRKWTEPLMPAAVKRSLGIADPPPAGTEG